MYLTMSVYVYILYMYIHAYCCWCSVMSNSLQPYGLYSSPGSPIHGVFWANILEWLAVSYSRKSSQSRSQTHSSCISCFGKQNTFTIVPSGKPYIYAIYTFNNWNEWQQWYKGWDRGNMIFHYYNVLVLPLKRYTVIWKWTWMGHKCILQILWQPPRKFF